MATQRKRLSIALGGLLAPLVCVAVVHAGGGALPLIEAVKQGDVVAVRSLLKQGAAVDVRQPDGTSALLWAAHSITSRSHERLFKRVRTSTPRTATASTPLWIASLNGSAPMIGLLLETGANRRLALPTGETPLMAAAAIRSR